MPVSPDGQPSNIPNHVLARKQYATALVESGLYEHARCNINELLLMTELGSLTYPRVTAVVALQVNLQFVTSEACYAQCQ
jgi:hypothetical protein